ncbi:unnamed protein product, partial [Heterotrigona itama]
VAQVMKNGVRAKLFVLREVQVSEITNANKSPRKLASVFLGTLKPKRLDFKHRVKVVPLSKQTAHF